MGCNLLVGYNSFLGMPILDGRKVFVDAKPPKKNHKPFNNYDEPEKSYNYISSFSIIDSAYANYVNKDTIKDVSIDWCIGGKKTYEKYCNLFTEMHISHINDDTDGNIFYPELRNLRPECKIFHYYFDID
jgi:dihydrofolate reductase